MNKLQSALDKASKLDEKQKKIASEKRKAMSEVDKLFIKELKAKGVKPQDYMDILQKLDNGFEIPEPEVIEVEVNQEPLISNDIYMELLEFAEKLKFNGKFYAFENPSDLSKFLAFIAKNFKSEQE